jgi:ethanolamine utilization protein EutQ
MSKRQLIVADDVRLAAKQGDKVIHLQSLQSIVTAQARSLAQELGLSFELGPAPAAAQASAASVDPEAVRRVIEAQTHGAASEEMMREVMRRISQEQAPSSQPVAAVVAVAVAVAPRKITSLCPSPKTSSASVNVSQLDLASLGLTQAAPSSSGFMGWSKNTYPFKRDSDELHLVLEGELNYEVGEATLTAKAGDVMWLPKGCQGKLGTATSVRYFFLTYSV